MHRLIATARILIADPSLIVVLLVWRVVVVLTFMDIFGQNERQA